MKQYNSSGTIIIKDKYGFTYNLCDLFYTEYEDETFKYIFKPNYPVIDLLGYGLFTGIPGLNLDLRREEYIRENRIPVFISERVPQKNREDYRQLLQRVNIDFMDPIEYLIRTDLQYFGDSLEMIPLHEKENVYFDKDISNESSTFYIKKILSNICLGNNVVINKNTIDDSNRKLMYEVFYYIYEQSVRSYKAKQKEGIEIGKSQGKYRGRKPKEFDYFKFIELKNKVKNKEITAIEAAKILGISKDKYYREIRKDK